MKKLRKEEHPLLPKSKNLESRIRQNSGKKVQFFSERWWKRQHEKGPTHMPNHQIPEEYQHAYNMHEKGKKNIISISRKETSIAREVKKKSWNDL